jgi:hypothetical protein
MAQVNVTPQQLAINVAHEAGVPIQHYVNSGSFLNSFSTVRLKEKSLMPITQQPLMATNIMKY